ncbi:MAG: phage tail tape measure protein, partial [Prevotellaceae bacterium]|nr:phage tail tape measure protein [Prevotellaceae bacterium]
MSNVINYTFNVDGNAFTQVNNMTGGVATLNGEVRKATSGIGRMMDSFARFGLVSDYFTKLNSAVQMMGASGISLDSQLHDLSAVAGVTGSRLKEIEGYARESAKAFGVDASQAVESYKLLLSQLSPELAKTPAALEAMGRSIATTSKLMGGDATSAAEVLTTAMNQFGVSLEDPMKAADEMARMMNVMAAAGRAGSAELPAIKTALQQCGMAAKAANISFEETNAAIQVLDKAGKKGSEGGVALRNVLTTLSKGRFLPKNTQEELMQAGIDVQLLGDKTKPLRERLESLKPILNDDALLSAFFGRENANAARALIQGTDSLRDFTDAVTGTTSAQDQAAIVMDSYAEKAARIHQQFEDLKISVFNATGGMSLWVGTIMEALVPLGQLIPLFQTAHSWISSIGGLSGVWSGIKGGIYAARVQMGMLNFELKTGKFESNGFVINMARATLGLVRFATVGIAQGLKALGSYLLSLVTTGTAQATFAATSKVAWTAFKTSATTACRAVGVAIKNIPIVGWIAAAIAAIVVLYQKVDWFRAGVKALFAGIKSYFVGMWTLAKNIFSSIWNFLKALVHFDFRGMKDALGQLVGGYGDYFKGIWGSAKGAYTDEMEKTRPEREQRRAERRRRKGKAGDGEGDGET